MDDGSVRLVKVSLSLATIMNHLGDSKRCLVEGEDVLNCDHVIECSVAPESTADNVRIIAYVLQSSALHNNPHTVHLCLGEHDIISLRCTCPAGRSSKCKHCVAVLLKTNRMQELPLLSSTDLPQAWGQHAKDVVKTKYAPRILQEIPFCPKFKYPVLPSVEPGILGRLMEGLPYECPVAIHNRKRPRQVTARPPTLLEALRSLPEEELENLLDKLKRVFTTDVIAEIERLTRAQALSSEWRLYRRGMATASVCYAFVTRARSLRKQPRPHNLKGLLDKVLQASTFQSASMKRGQDKEAAAKECYLSLLRADGHSPTVRNTGLLIWEQMPIMGGSPDGIVKFGCTCCQGKEVLLEIKCPEILQNSFRGKTEAPQYQYYTQMQVYMSITGILTCDFFVYVSETDYKLVQVNHDPGHFNECVNAVRTIYVEYLFTGLKGISC